MNKAIESTFARLGIPSNTRLNALLAEAEFDTFAEAQCAPYYAEKQGRPSIPPGVYFRMVLVGYFEGLDAQRAIAWRCSDSLALREFLGLGMTKPVPEHSSLTVTRQRLPLAVHEAVFARILELAATKGLLRGKTSLKMTEFGPQPDSGNHRQDCFKAVTGRRQNE